ncbi:hypothetical protein [Mesorhizobium sp. SARCC-RB16n]|uniref:hypothetical protein n=1 Tax=Mesorhizobium sp. SARCC-RB16n TaxID=2116687 RepID=UPI001666BCEB|nr:hypothetical protein [Mesorhizobium sp. SARCC-RB16n]
MMILLVMVVGGLVVTASYVSKWDFQKRMRKLRADEAAFRDRKSQPDTGNDHRAQ